MSAGNVKCPETTERDEFIAQNLGLVHSCAARFRGRGIEYDDLFQAGCLGMIKAYDGFERERGLRFSTYAVPVILGEIKKLFRDGGTLKVSRRLKELSLKAKRMSDEIVKRTGAEPVMSELAEALGCEEELLVEAMCAAQPAVSLTCAADEGEGGQWDLPVDSEEELITEQISLQAALRLLDDDERMILKERFCRGRTQAATAEVLGTTQVRISRQERKIIEKLRRIIG